MEWIDQIDGANQHPIRHVLLYFLFPGYLDGFGRLWQPGSSLKEPTDTPVSPQPVDKGEPDPRSDPAARQSLNRILYGPPGTGKTYATTRRCVEIRDGQEQTSKETGNVHRRYRELVQAGRVEFITFHQSYGYEEFVEGLRPDTGGAETAEEAGIGFHLVATDGVLKRIADRARKTPDEPHVLVIDEINRANVSRVMGELIMLLKEDKREREDNEVAVTLPHSGDRFTLPSNLHILGTMNTADRINRTYRHGTPTPVRVRGAGSWP